MGTALADMGTTVADFFYIYLYQIVAHNAAAEWGLFFKLSRVPNLLCTV